MNYFARHRSNFIIILLVVLNLGLLLTLWLGRPRGPQGPPVGPFLERELDLSAEQREQFHRLRDGHFQTTRPIAEQMREDRRAMIAALTGPAPDPEAARRLATAIGEQQATLEALLVQHFLDLKAICTPEQQARLDRLFLDAMARPPLQQPFR